MQGLLIALGILVGSGIAALVLTRSARCSTAIATAGAVAGCVVGLVPAFRVLARERFISTSSTSWRWSCCRLCGSRSARG